MHQKHGSYQNHTDKMQSIFLVFLALLGICSGDVLDKYNMTAVSPNQCWAWAILINNNDNEIFGWWFSVIQSLLSINRPWMSCSCKKLWLIAWSSNQKNELGQGNCNSGMLQWGKSKVLWQINHKNRKIFSLLSFESQVRKASNLTTFDIKLQYNFAFIYISS